jgi:transketolase N-terminal domain/subunit
MWIRWYSTNEEFAKVNKCFMYKYTKQVNTVYVLVGDAKMRESKQWKFII